METMPYKIYAWGHDSQIAAFDVSSLLLSQLISIHALENEYEIIPNSDIFKSHSGRLPMLPISGTQQLTGFEEIWAFITSNQFLNQGQTALNKKDKIIQKALLKNVLKNLQLLTLYNFFVIKKNYEGYTRPEFPKLLPWPTQYKAPVDMKNFAFENCLNEGIIDDDSGNVSTYLDTDLEDELQNLKNQEKNLRETPVVNEIQKTQMDKQLESIALKKSVISNMHCIKILKSLLIKIQGNNDPLVKVVILVYLKCNTIDALPENFIKVWLEREYPELAREVVEFSPQINTNSQSQKISLANAIKSLLANIF